MKTNSPLKWWHYLIKYYIFTIVRKELFHSSETFTKVEGSKPLCYVVCTICFYVMFVFNVNQILKYVL